MKIDDAIGQLGRQMGFELALDDNRACRLLFDGTLAVDIEAPRALPDTLVMSCKVAGGLPADGREAVLRMLLEANLFGRGTGGGVLAIDDERDEIVLHRTLAMNRADVVDLVDALEQLLQYAEAWIGKLGQVGSPRAVDEAHRANAFSAMLRV